MSNRDWSTAFILSCLALLWLAVIAGSDAQQTAAALGVCVFIAGRLVMDELLVRTGGHLHLVTIVGRDGSILTTRRPLTTEEQYALDAGNALFKRLEAEAQAAEQPGGPDA